MTHQPTPRDHRASDECLDCYRTANVLHPMHAQLYCAECWNTRITWRAEADAV